MRYTTPFRAQGLALSLASVLSRLFASGVGLAFVCRRDRRATCSLRTLRAARDCARTIKRSKSASSIASTVSHAQATQKMTKARVRSFGSSTSRKKVEPATIKSSAPTTAAPSSCGAPFDLESIRARHGPRKTPSRSVSFPAGFPSPVCAAKSKGGSDFPEGAGALSNNPRPMRHRLPDGRSSSRCSCAGRRRWNRNHPPPPSS